MHLAPVIITAVIAAVSVGYKASNEGDLSTLQSTLTAIESALNFIDKRREAVNLDGIIGIRMVEGQFTGLLARYWTQMPLWLVGRLKAIQRRASALGDAATESVRRTTPEYFAIAGLLVSDHHTWDTFYPPRRMTEGGGDAPSPGTSPDASGVNSENFEPFSDSCIFDFSGGDGHPRCTVSKRCWEVMAASKGRQGYLLTHQLLYLMSGIQLNCLQNLTALAAREKDNLVNMMTRKCSSVFAEALALEKLNFPLKNRDLFMEQIAICGTAGFTEIAQRRWLDRILSWQRAGQGCFGIFEGEEETSPSPPQTQGQHNDGRRSKRVEAQMSSDGCLSHRTSVALGALTTFVRRSIEEAAAEIRG